MNILHIVSPGMIPTGTPEYPEYLLQLTSKNHCLGQVLNLNKAFWEWVLSTPVLQETASIKNTRNQEALEAIDKLNHAFQCLHSESFYDPEKYLGALQVIWSALSIYGSENWHLDPSGYCVYGLTSDSVARMEEYSLTADKNPWNPFIDYIVSAFPFEKYELLCFSIRKSFDFLPIFTLIQKLQAKNHHFYSVIVEHGWEDFSLLPILPSFLASEVIKRYIDTVVIYREERPTTMDLLYERLNQGRGVSDLPNLAGFSAGKPFCNDKLCADNPLPSLENKMVEALPTDYFQHIWTPHPVVMLRASSRRCYWSQCTFCAQNRKYRTRQNLGSDWIQQVITRIESMKKMGVNHFFFTDEAFSPQDNREFSNALLVKNLKIQWFGRTRIEPEYTAELAKLMAQSGCREVLFGVETVSSRLLQRMQKSDHINQTEVKRILTEFETAGIGCIVSMIFGFPGERMMEYCNSFRFLKDLQTELEWITFYLNRFRLLAGSAIYENPREYGIKIKPKTTGNDLQTVFPYQETGFPKFRNFDRDYRRFHEKNSDLRQLAKTNRHFYYFVRFMLDQTLHGFLYKTRYKRNPFINF